MLLTLLASRKMVNFCEVGFSNNVMKFVDPFGWPTPFVC